MLSINLALHKSGVTGLIKFIQIQLNSSVTVKVTSLKDSVTLPTVATVKVRYCHSGRSLSMIRKISP